MYYTLWLKWKSQQGITDVRTKASGLLALCADSYQIYTGRVQWCCETLLTQQVYSSDGQIIDKFTLEAVILLFPSQFVNINKQNSMYFNQSFAIVKNWMGWSDQHH